MAIMKTGVDKADWIINDYRHRNVNQPENITTPNGSILCFPVALRELETMARNSDANARTILQSVIF
jgi:hypothetical protein